MKVMLIDVNCGEGSTGKIVYDLYSGLKKNNENAVIAYGRGKKISEDGIYKFSCDIEMYIHAFLARITGLNGYFSFFATKKLLKIIKQEKPDVIHIHDPKTYYMNPIKLYKYCSERKIPVVFTLHSEYQYTGKCGHSLECIRWKDKCGNCPHLKEYPKSLWFDFTEKMLADKKKGIMSIDKKIIVTPSKWLAERVRQSYLKDNEVRVVYNGIDTSVFRYRGDSGLRRKIGIDNDDFVVLSIAPNLMSDLKGGKWVIEIARSFCNEKIKFIMIGVSDEEKVCGENIISLNVIKDQELLSQYYSISDVTLLTSKKETFSLVCAESLACGTPVIGFDAGAPKEIAPKPYGNFVEYGNIEEIKKILLKLMKDREIMADRHKCIEFANENYGISVMFRNYFMLYKEILNKV